MYRNLCCDRHQELERCLVPCIEVNIGNMLLHYVSPLEGLKSYKETQSGKRATRKVNGLFVLL